VVIGDSFAWGHLPKTAGDATLRLWRILPRLIVEADDDGTNAKHATFLDRADQTSGKLLILNLRRLPAWNMSHAQHETQGGLFPDFQPLPMPSPDEIAERTFADDMLALFTGRGQVKIDHWLRQENLELDFLTLVTKLTDMSEWQRKAVQHVGPVNVHRYNHNTDDWFTSAQIVQMYERNPVWASIERRVYGFTLDEIPGRRARHWAAKAS
jgi:hypothetical protein